jgi:hypothetical protein
LIRAVVGPVEALQSVRKYNGQPFRPIEIIEPIRRIAALALRQAQGDTPMEVI